MRQSVKQRPVFRHGALLRPAISGGASPSVSFRARFDPVFLQDAVNRLKGDRQTTSRKSSHEAGCTLLGRRTASPCSKNAS